MRPLRHQFIWPVLGVTVLALLAMSLVPVIVIVQKGGGAFTAGWSPSRKEQGVDAYRGLGAWVDLWDARAWRDPAATVSDMNSHGVNTIYIETATAKSATGLVNPSALRTFITEAHARHMYVVAWYFPSMKPGSVDYGRVVQTVEFKTGDGQRFDSVALDIESSDVKPFGARNRGLAALSRMIRNRVGPSYPLGAIIPPPVGLEKKTGFWDIFPYATVAESYDVILPMAYYTYHVHTAAQTRADVIANMRLLRAQPGCSKIPVHLIGGIAGSSSSAEVRQFARAARTTGCIGASLYDWVGTNDAKWRELEAVWAARAR